MISVKVEEIVPMVVCGNGSRVSNVSVQNLKPTQNWEEREPKAKNQMPKMNVGESVNQRNEQASGGRKCEDRRREQLRVGQT